MPQPSDPEQCRNEDGFRPDTSGFGAQMGSESRSVRGLTGENLGAVLVSQLPICRLYYSDQNRIRYLKRVSEMVRHVRRHDAGCQSGAEHLVGLPDRPIAQTPDEFAAVQTERSCAVEDKSSDRVSVL